MKKRSGTIDKKLQAYCGATGKDWCESTKLQSYSILYQFHLWIKEQNIKIKLTTPLEIEIFVRDRKPKSKRTYRRKVRRYLRWIRGEELQYQVSSNLWPAWKLGKSTPPSLEQFLKAHSIGRSEKTVENYKYSLRRFHAWLETTGAAISQVDERHLLDFSRALSQYDCKTYDAEKGIQQLRIYLYWLHQNGIIRLMDPASCARDRKFGGSNTCKLSRDPLVFLAMVSTYLKPATVSNYKATLSHLHFFLNREKLHLKEIKRTDLEDWLIYLEKASLGPVWRRSIIIRTRIYLRWLHEHGKIKHDADLLLKRSDMPKRPQYLPKPLRPEDDLSLQDALKIREDLNSKALLLMRWTGVRIGELVDLTRDCVWIDHVGRKFIKVPIGKLNNERMVPVSDETFQLVEHIKKLSAALLSNGQLPEKLIYHPAGPRVCKNECRLILHWVCREIGIKNRVNAHRLRHTYATSLLNGGMSLVGVMKLLGHHSTQMTLLYAAVSPETVREEYLLAIEKIEDRCRVQVALEAISAEQIPTIENTFSDLIRLIQKTGQLNGANSKNIKSFIKQVRHLKTKASAIF